MMSRRQTAFAAVPLVALAALAALGCRAPIARIGPGAPPPGVLWASTNSPIQFPDDGRLELDYSPDRIEILGWFSLESSSSGLTARLPSVGSRDMIGAQESDYRSSFAEILRVNELDGLLNKTVDTRRWVLNLFVLRFSRWHTEVGGIGFRLKRPEDRALLASGEKQEPGRQNSLVPTPR